MNGADTVSVQISANVSGLISGLKDATSATASSSAAMRDNLAEVGRGAHEAGGGIDVFTHHVRQMRSEMRLSNFMAAQIADMGFASKSAAAEVTGLVSAFALGGGIGVAIESVKMVIKAFRELGAEEAKAAAEMKKFVADLDAGTERLAASVTEALLKMHGATEAEMLQHALLTPLLYREQAAAEALSVARGNLASAKKAEATTDVEAIANAGALAQAQREYDKALEEHSALLTALSAGYEQLSILTSAQEVKDAEKAAAEELRIAEEEADAKEQFLDREVESYHKAMNAQVKAEFEAAKALQKMDDEQDAYKLARNAKIEKAEDDANKKRAAEAKHIADVIADTISSNMIAVLNGTKSLGDAVVATLKGFAEEIIKELVKTAAEAVASLFTASLVKAANIVKTHSNIAVAASGAAAAVASIPIVGPAMAIGAASSVAGSLMALTAPLLVAEGGMERVSGTSLAVLHKDEQVWPAAFADRVRDLLDRADGSASGGGGDTYQITITAIDGASVRSFVESYEFRRAVREARRNGLIE